MTEKEFNHIVLPLAPIIWSFASNLTGDKDSSADIVQDVMLRLWNGRKSLGQISNIKAYALRIARNLCLDSLKKQQPLYDEEQVIRNGGYNPDALRQIAAQDTAEAVRRIIATLPPNQREVMILRELEELEYDEISRITGLGLNNIRVLLSRGRSKVKEILVNQYQISSYEE